MPHETDQVPESEAGGWKSWVPESVRHLLPTASPADDWTQYVCLREFGCMLPIASPERATEVFRAEFDSAWKHGAFWNAVWHPFVSGRMSRSDAMEGLIDSDFIAGVLDLTTTELADQLIGGVLPAGPDRLEVAGREGIPAVVSLGALDMVNFGARDTVPPEFEPRNLYVHNPSVTLMRTTPEENAELGRIIASKLAGASAPVALFIPLGGVSAIDIEGGPFFDPEADQALFDAVRENLPENVELHELAHNINDPEFALAMVDKLVEYLEADS